MDAVQLIHFAGVFTLIIHVLQPHSGGSTCFVRRGPSRVDSLLSLSSCPFCHPLSFIHFPIPIPVPHPSSLILSLPSWLISPLRSAGAARLSSAQCREVFTGSPWKMDTIRVPVLKTILCRTGNHRSLCRTGVSLTLSFQNPNDMCIGISTSENSIPRQSGFDVCRMLSLAEIYM